MKITNMHNLKTFLIILLFLSQGSISLNAQKPSTGLILFYPFNGNANDASGNGNNGIVSGAELTADRFGNFNSAYSFDGIDDYIYAENSTSLQSPANQVTVSAWVCASGNSFRHYIVDKRIHKSEYPFTSYVLCSSRDEIKTWQFTASPAPIIDNKTLVASSSSTIINNVWVHITGVYDSSEVKIYINGVLEGSESVSGPISYSDLPLYIGTAANVPDHFMNGFIDDVRIYNRALDSVEISNLYSNDACNEIIYENISVYDTSFVTVTDTSYVTVVDTSYVTVTDTLHNVIIEKISVTDTLYIDITLAAIVPFTETNTIKIFPNPAKDILYINTGENNLSIQGYSISIINSGSQKMFQGLLNQGLIEIDLKNFKETGLYFIQINDPDNQLIEVKKLILY